MGFREKEEECRREKGRERERIREQAGIIKKRTEIRISLNFIATLEARRQFSVLKENYFYLKIST